MERMALISDVHGNLTALEVRHGLYRANLEQWRAGDRETGYHERTS
ncbi:hypothetical protein [Nocardioides sp. InS609-2]|nr:hypothetical protein [Nocardioides sp. InS609-2]